MELHKEKALNYSKMYLIICLKGFFFFVMAPSRPSFKPIVWRITLHALLVWFIYFSRLKIRVYKYWWFCGSLLLTLILSVGRSLLRAQVLDSSGLNMCTQNYWNKARSYVHMNCSIQDRAFDSWSFSLYFMSNCVSWFWIWVYCCFLCLCIDPCLICLMLYM